MGLFSSVKKFGKKIVKGAKKALPYAAAAGGAYLGYNALSGSASAAAATGGRRGGGITPYKPPSSSWLGNLGSSAASAAGGFLGNVGSSALNTASTSLGSYLGNLPAQYFQGSGGGGSGSNTPAQDYNKFNIEDVKAGHAADLDSHRNTDAYDWRVAKQRGLTPQEFYGSSAAGGAGSSGGAQILGNSHDRQQSIQADQAQQSQERQKDRTTQLQQTQMQTQAQIQTAEIAAGQSGQNVKLQTDTQRYSADLQNAIATKNYKLANQKLQTIDKPKLLAELNINSKQLQKLSNEIATSTPAFTLYMKKLSMGVDNMMVEFLQHSYGVDITNPKSVQSMSAAERAAFINHTAAIQSNVFKEAAGITLGVSDRAEETTNSLSQLYDSYIDTWNQTFPGNKPSTKPSRRNPRVSQHLK